MYQVQTTAHLAIDSTQGDQMTSSRNRNRRSITLGMNVLLAVAFAWALTFSAAASQTAIVDSEIGHRPVAPLIEWSATLAAQFPGCAASLPKGVIPSEGVEVRSGFPVRVGFDDAWKRTHDADDSNNGEVIAACR